jgi:broad specificity phosphatase PhoE
VRSSHCIMDCIQSRMTGSSIGHMMQGYLPSEKLEPKSSDLGPEDFLNEVDLEAGPEFETIQRNTPGLPINMEVMNEAKPDNCLENDLAAPPEGEHTHRTTPDRQRMDRGASPNAMADSQAENGQVKVEAICKVESSQSNGEKELRTPPRPKQIRRRIDGSPIFPVCNMPPKTIYLLRHGFSQGQAAQTNGLDRKTDQSLRDCGLTEQGIKEAQGIPYQFSDEEMSTIQIVFSSPFTRALHTAALGFPDKNIICHFDLGEIGSKAPENTPRKMTSVLKDIRTVVEERDDRYNIDVTTYQPTNWPRDCAPSVIKKEKVKKFFQWLYKEREETTIAVVCHHNVIKTALIEGEKMRPKNAQVIPCSLNSNGELFVNSQRFELNIVDFKVYGSMSRKTRAIQERKNTQSDPFPMAFR